LWRGIFAADFLARAGVGAMTIVDGDWLYHNIKQTITRYIQPLGKLKIKVGDNGY
jgi:tRNA A37 threonylcarbamoyladenosine dehydratase